MSIEKESVLEYLQNVIYAERQIRSDTEDLDIRVNSLLNERKIEEVIDIIKRVME